MADPARLRVNNKTGQIAVYRGNDQYQIYNYGEYKWNKNTGEYALPAGNDDTGQSMYEIFNPSKTVDKRYSVGRGGYINRKETIYDRLPAPPIAVDADKDGKVDAFVDRGPQDAGWRTKLMGVADSIPWSDELVAGALALKHADQAGGWKKAYDVIQPIVEARYENAERVDPEGYLLGQVGGGLASFGGAALGAKALRAAPAVIKEAPKAVSNVGRLLRSARIGGGWGAAYGSGEGTGSDRIGNAVTGAVLGGGLGAAPGIIKGAGGVLKSLVQPFTQAGQKQIVANTLARLAREPRSILELAQSEVPGVNRTLGQSSGDIGIRSIEKSFPQIREDLAVRAAENNAARLSYLDSQAPMAGRPAEELGQVIKDRARSSYEAAKARTDKAYSSVDPTNSTSIDFRPIYEAVAPDINRAFSMRTGGTPEDLVSIMQRLRGTNNTDLASTDVMRRELYNIASQASNSGDNVKAAAATDIAKAIDTHLNGIASGEVKGALSPSQVEQLRQARSLRSQQDDIFERGTMGDVLKRDRYGKDELEASKVIDQYLSASPEKAAQFIKAVGSDPQALDALKRGVIDKLKTVTGNINLAEEATLAPKRFNDALDGLNPIISRIFTDAEQKALRIIGADLTNQAASSAVPGAASKLQQNLATSNILAQILGNRAADNSLLHNLAFPLNWTYKISDNQIRDKLGQALLNPAEIKKMLDGGIKIPWTDPNNILPKITGAVSGENQ